MCLPFCKPLLVGCVLLAAVDRLSAQDLVRAPDGSTSPGGTTAGRIVITGEEPPYAATGAPATAKIDVPLKDLPLSVQVVPRELLQDRGVTRLDQALDDVSGVHAEASYGGNGATFFSVRGFTTSNGLRDGFRNYGYLAFRDVQSIERIEVLKGPSGALYGGVGSLGGYLATVSKQPEGDLFGRFDVTAGSYGLVRPTLDVNLPLVGGLNARLNASFEHNDNFRDRAGYNSFDVAPSFKWEVNQRTSVLLLTEYGRLEREGFDFGVPNLPGYTGLPRTGYYGLPADHGDNDTCSATLVVEHYFDDDWRLRLGGHYTYASQRSVQSFPNNSLYPDGDLLPFTSYFGAKESSDDAAGQAELYGKFRTGPPQHNLLVGAEYAYLNQGSGPTRLFDYNLSLSQPGRISDYTPAGMSAGGRAQANTVGIYLSDLIEVTPQWKVLLGGRQDWSFAETQTGTGDFIDHAQENHFSGRAGLVWQPVPVTSLYFSYGRSFVPNIGHSTSSAVYASEEGEQYEVGLKQDLIRDRLTATLCAFNLTRSHILTACPTDPNVLIQTGEQRSRGIELDAAGEILPGWRVIASYAHDETAVGSDTTFPVGQPLSNVPRDSGSLWTTYRLQIGRLKGLGVGAGQYYVGRREANLPNTYDLAAYWRTDASVFYEREHWRVQVNVLNVLDRHYYTGGETGTFNYTLNPSQPVTVQGTLSYEF